MTNKTMLKLLILINLCCEFSLCFIFEYPLTKMITLNDSKLDFGYSILLQKGNPPIAIVGAPRKKYNHENRGAVYRCNLNTLHCDEYKRISSMKGIYPINKNGDLLGITLEGDDIAGGKFFTCAPRFITLAHMEDYYLKGRCFRIENSTNIYQSGKVLLPLSLEREISLDKRIPYYDSAFGEAGVDISYLKAQNMLLIGTPGKSLWNGGLVRNNIFSSRNDVYLGQLDLAKNSDSYFGYAVAWGKFVNGSPNVWYACGGPRGNGLKGQVVFFEQNGRVVRDTILNGEELGSYYGASLLVIHKNGGGDDLLVGAPMYSGGSWDEGCVYYYKNKNSGVFNSPTKLSSKKSGSRFGTVMAALGDIDLDSFVDCAISAPYEDNGIGAVYIYFGTKEGFSSDKVERISPSHFPSIIATAVRGFGLGISNSIDIDNNNHNDIAVGAYKSGQIFFFITRQFFDVTMNLTSDKTILYTSTTSFSVTYCISMSFRNRDKIKMLSFLVNIILDDDRILKRQNSSEAVSLRGSQKYCQSKTVLLKKNHLNVEPLTIHYGYKLNVGETILYENTFIIPVTYECGEDNICQTNISVKATSDINQVVVGVNNELRINVTITNVGESAYQTKLYLKVPPEISLINLRECDFETGSYVCTVAQVLKNETIEKSFLLDLTNLDPSRKTLPINFIVKSIGQDVNLNDNNIQVNIPVVLQSSPHIDSRVYPEHVFLNKSEPTMEVTHTFLVGNNGPSPLDLNFTIFVPQMRINGSNVLKISSVEGTVNGAVTKCNFLKNKMVSFPAISRKNSYENTRLIRCEESLEKCTNIVCIGGFLPKSNKNSVFSVKMIFHVESLDKFIEDSNNKILFVSSGYYTNGTDVFFTTASTLILSIPQFKIPFWIYLAAVVSGLILLLLLVYFLYKCNFFKRNYKELMEVPHEEPKEHHIFDDSLEEENKDEAK